MARGESFGAQVNVNVGRWKGNERNLQDPTENGGLQVFLKIKVGFPHAFKGPFTIVSW